VAVNPLPAKPCPVHRLRDLSGERELLCNAIIKQLPVEWRCSRCHWRYSIALEVSSELYASDPPDNVVAAFNLHPCE